MGTKFGFHKSGNYGVVKLKIITPYNNDNLILLQKSHERSTCVALAAQWGFVDKYSPKYDFTY